MSRPPFSGTFAPNENNAPDRKGPIVRPPAETVCARPFIAPRTARSGAQFVIY